MKNSIDRPSMAVMAPIMLTLFAGGAAMGLGHGVRSGHAGPTAASVEQTVQGREPGAKLVESFDGLGVGFRGPQGPYEGGNPSDNSLAVGPNDIVQIVNTRMAIFTKKGAEYDKTGRVLYGAVPTNTVFKGFGGACASINSGDAVVRYDQLAHRWLIVMPIFRRLPARPDQPPMWTADGKAHLSVPGVAGQPGPAVKLFVPPLAPADSQAVWHPRHRHPSKGHHRRFRRPQGHGPYAMCYAISTSSDPMGSYYRYEFLRPLFPDYPRPAVWPDGYYVPTSSGDHVIQKQACVVDRQKMLAGKPASEQCIILNGVSFLENADVLGETPPPAGAPNIMMAAGGAQLDSIFHSDVINVWHYHVDWNDPSRTKLTGPVKIHVAPYHFLCNGQLTQCVPQPGTDQRLDAQGDKLMARLVYRNVDGKQRIVAAQSVNTTAGGGGVRWYEFTVHPDDAVTLYQEGTYAPGGAYRWMPSAAIDKFGNIGIGYSFGGRSHFPGQRFAGRLAGDPLGKLTLHETVLARGEGSQTYGNRWEDYTQTGVDPSDDCTIWYVGDYYKRGAPTYSTRIGAFRMPGCTR